jgi:flavin-binding protein dodecin
MAALGFRGFHVRFGRSCRTEAPQRVRAGDSQTWEETMKRPRKDSPAGSKASAMTGRDGAVDFAAKAEFLSESTHSRDHIYRVIQIVGSSETSIEDAIGRAVERANRTIRNLRWFEIVRTSGHIENGSVRHYQVTLEVGFTMEQA